MMLHLTAFCRSKNYWRTQLSGIVTFNCPETLVTDWIFRKYSEADIQMVMYKGPLLFGILLRVLMPTNLKSSGRNSRSSALIVSFAAPVTVTSKLQIRYYSPYTRGGIAQIHSSLFRFTLAPIISFPSSNSSYLSFSLACHRPFFVQRLLK
jgi:hypothetical protein